MAYLDLEAARAEKERKDAYDELKNEPAWRSSLRNTERTWDQQMGELNISGFQRALEYLQWQEEKAAKNESPYRGIRAILQASWQAYSSTAKHI